jgi:hypothetical protein
VIKNKYFDLVAIQEKKENNSSAIHISKYLVAHYELIKKLDTAIKRLPTSEEFFFLQSDTSFNAFTFIPLVGKFEAIKEMYASTYSISRNVIDALVQLHDEGVIEKITLMISDSLLKRNPATIDYLKALISGRPNFEVTFSWVHAKVCVMETASNYYVVEGSGNWASNAHYEQYLFANSKGLFDFRKTLFTEARLRG